MFQKPMEWLRRTWWGLIVAYLILASGLYFVIWQFAEPLGIPNRVEILPELIKSRVFIHLTLTLVLAAYITLLLDLYVRRQITSTSQDRVANTLRKCEDTGYCTVRIIRSRDELESVFNIPDSTEKEKILELLARSGCLLEGHFRLVSGKHSSRFIRYRKILENPDSREYFVSKMATLVSKMEFSTIIGPSATAGGILAQEVARVLGAKVITFPSPSVFGKRGLSIPDTRAKGLLGERCVYVDDLTTTGEGVLSAVESLREKNILVVGVAVTFVRDQLAAVSVKKRLKEKGVEFVFFGYADLTGFTWDAADCKLCQLIYSQDLN